MFMIVLGPFRTAHSSVVTVEIFLWRWTRIGAGGNYTAASGSGLHHSQGKTVPEKAPTIF
jgi:hypothetical protein